MKIWREITTFIKWIVRVVIAVTVVLLIGAAIAALYKEAAPNMYMWYCRFIQKIF